jgi:hypothetical protein
MFARVLGLTVLCLALTAFGTQAGGDKGTKDAPAKDKDATKEKKDAKKPEPITGKLKAVDFEKGSFVLTLEGDKQRTFHVDEGTKFIGPLGGSRGMGKAGLKDDTMEKGSEVRVIPDSVNEKLAAEVYLPKRKSTTKDDDKAKKDAK